MTFLLGLSGSLRKQSYNTAVLRTLQAAVAMRVELRLWPLDDIPPYNADLDGPSPPSAVGDLKRAIDQCAGLVVCSPEYNYGISGVLKNALDWASRPANKSPLRGKPVLIMTASTAYTGGARAQYQLRETLCSCLAVVLARPQIVIANAKDKIRDGTLVDAAVLEFAVAGVEDLLSEIQLRKG